MFPDPSRKFFGKLSENGVTFYGFSFGRWLSLYVWID